jgi:hypothetical protein
MLDFLHDLPNSTLAFLCSAGFVAATWLGILFIRPFLRLWLRGQTGCNDLVNHASSGFGLLYGLLLGLLSVAAYQNMEKIQQTVGLEAANIGSLYRTVASYPEPTRGEVQGLLRDYILFVIHKDWPAQKKGRSISGGVERLSVIQKRLTEFEPETKTQEILHAEALADLKDLRDARQARVAGNLVAIPGVLWYVVLVGAGVYMLLFWLLDARILVQLFLGGIVSFFLGVMIYLIIAMDRPTRGEVSVSSDIYQAVYDDLMRWDER